MGQTEVYYQYTVMYKNEDDNYYHNDTEKYSQELSVVRRLSILQRKYKYCKIVTREISLWKDIRELCCTITQDEVSEWKDCTVYVTIYDLLGMIKSKDLLPQKIKYKNKIWTYNEDETDYINSDCDLFISLFNNYYIKDFIGDKVEVIR